MGVTVRRKHLEHAITQLEDGNVVCTTTQIEDHNLLIGCFFVHTVGQSRGGGLVDDAFDFEASDFASFFGGLALGVVEVCRDGDDRAGHFRTEVIFRRLLHFLKGHGADFLWRVQPVVDFDARRVVVSFDHLVRHPADFRFHFIKRVSHETLDAENRFLRVGDGLALGRFAHLALTAVDEGDDGRRRALSFRVCNDHRFVALHDGDAAVGGTQINSNDFTHS